jgi:hypothetical protein
MSSDLAARTSTDPLGLDGLDGLEPLTTLSAETIGTTFAAMRRTLETVSTECAAVSETLETLGDALQVVSQGAGTSQDWGGFGMISLPIVGTIRAVKGVAGQFVRQHTGVPLSTWVDLVSNATEQFAQYVSQMDAVSRLAEVYDAREPGAVDPERAREDLAVLREVQWRTRAWKQVLGQVAQLGRLVEAMLQVRLLDETAPAETPSEDRAGGLAGSLHRRLKDVQTRAVEKSGGLQDWVLQPFVDIRDRVMQLPDQTQQLAHEVALLEVLLDLEATQIRAVVGNATRDESTVVAVRVAASVVLPELALGLADARRRAAAYETYLVRLDTARTDGTVTESAHAVLAAEYCGEVERSRSTLAALELEADAWRRRGRRLVDGCIDWTDRELAVLDARRLVERDGDDERAVLLRRERERLGEARGLLDVL